MILVRPATLSDEQAVLVLLAQLFGSLAGTDERASPVAAARSRSFRRMLNSERGAVLVAEEAGQVLGVISLSFNLAIRFETAYAQIEELVVDEAARGRQAGALLVRAALDHASREGCNEIGLYPREETRAFYEKLGFRYAGVELRQALPSAPGHP